MSDEVAAVPPPREGLGCFGKGCAAFAGLFVFLLIAVVGGAFFGIHYLRGYSSPEPSPIPVVEATPPVVTDEATPMEVAPTPEPTAAPVIAAQPAPAIGPAMTPPPATAKPISHNWKTFEYAAKHGEPASVELTAGEINGLISGSNARGKVYVAIDNNIGHVQVSMPLKGVYLMDGRYLNGSLDVQASPDGNPASARITNVIVNGRSVSDGFLDQGLFGYPSLRTVVSNWLNKQNIGSFRIEKNMARGTSSAGSGK